MATTLSISPQQIEYLIKPGASIIQAYKIKNDSPNHLYLTTNIEPWQALGNDGLISYQNVSPNPNIEFSLNNSDIQLGQTFSLEPNTEKQLVLKIKASPTAIPSDYYSTFFITQQASTNNNTNSQSSASIKIGSHILLSISNSESNAEELKITNFHITPKFKDILFNKIQFSADIINNSDYFSKINGSLNITKNQLPIQNIPLSQLNVLSHSNRKIYCSYQNNSDSANCSINPPFWPGKYIATINLTSPTATQSASLSFFVFPYILTIIILIISFISFTVFSIKKHLVDKP